MIKNTIAAALIASLALACGGSTPPAEAPAEPEQPIEGQPEQLPEEAAEAEEAPEAAEGEEAEEAAEGEEAPEAAEGEEAPAE